MAESSQQSLQQDPQLHRGKVPSSLLNGLVKVLTWQQLHDNIDWVLRLVHCLKAEHILMRNFVKLSQNSQFIHQTLFTVLCTIWILLGKSLYSESETITESFCFINSGEIAFSQFANGSKHLMKPSLIDSLPKDPIPLLSISLLKEQAHFLSCLIEKPNPKFLRSHILLNRIKDTSFS